MNPASHKATQGKPCFETLSSFALARMLNDCAEGSALQRAIKKEIRSREGQHKDTQTPWLTFRQATERKPSEALAKEGSSMTLEVAMERAELERDIPQLERALTNPNMAASQRGSAENKMALERIGQKRVRLEEIRSRKSEVGGRKP